MGRNELGLKWLSKKLYRAGTFSIASLYSYRFNILYVLENWSPENGLENGEIYGHILYWYEDASKAFSFACLGNKPWEWYFSKKFLKEPVSIELVSWSWLKSTIVLIIYTFYALLRLRIYEI